MQKKMKTYTLKRIEDCLAACEGITEPVTTLNEVRVALDELFEVTENEGIITTDVDKVIKRLFYLRVALRR